ncbi:uncharacterized protein PRCAT00004638001 [Priceomyces carsonii]|uniref:uncharacterized protein n=1 Tax=Priceomyces carsonii TaxID=28549 RepID=UPI002ED972A0|nr:unnamed protein product [Priceomyces carsonii]
MSEDTNKLPTEQSNETSSSPSLDGLATIQSSCSENDEKPSFNYDLDLFNLCKLYLENKNHHGLALISRQKGLPPFLRFRIWPILLKYHPFVINPFLQPDSDAINKSDSESSTGSDSSTASSPGIEEDEIKIKIRKDLGKYVQRLRHSSSFELSDIESQIFEILQQSILKFTLKWNRIIKYDEALTWIALNLAEWFPPIVNTPWVLVGRDNANNKRFVKSLFDDYSNYIESISGLNSSLNSLLEDTSNTKMSFHDVYERLVLVILHSPEERNKESSTSNKIDKTILPISGGTIEDRVSFFIYCLRKLLPELSKLFQEEQILNKFGNNDDEWLIWWLKYCGAKVWSKFDRGRIWDLLLGWRLKNPKRDMEYYNDKLDMDKELLNKLGPDVFWSVSDEDETDQKSKLNERSKSFKDLINGLSDLDTNQLNYLSTPSSKLKNWNLDNSLDDNVPFAKLDPQIELIFVSLALLRSKENTLVDLDQHEIRQYLSRLPSNSYKYKQNKKNYDSPMKRQPHSTQSSTLISNDSSNNHKVDFMDNIINEAGELWRKFFWLELQDS